MFGEGSEVRGSMTLINCPDCGGALSDLAPTCIHCGRPRTPPAVTPNIDAPASAPLISGPGVPVTTGSAAQPFPFFPVATHKFVVLSIFSFGVYELYWFFQNWKRIKTASGEALSPFWRAFFAPLWSFSLFRRVRDRAVEAEVAAAWSPGILGALYLILCILWRLPDPWWLICYASFLPMLPVQQTATQVNRRSLATEDPNTAYSTANVVLIVLGGIALVLVMIGLVIPDEAGA